MIVGTFVAAVAAYLFQLVAGRSLGPHAFAPITVLWTIQFLAFTTVFLPIEQLTIRRLNSDAPERTPWRLFFAVIALTAIIATAVSVATRDRLLDGEWVFVGITAVLVTAYGVFALGRGFLAGNRRFREYGLTTLAESVLRLVAASLLLAAGFGTVGIAWTLVIGSAVVLFWRPFAGEPSRDADVESGTAAALGAFVAANASAQALVAAGPLVVGGLGASAGAVSVFFETFLLFRAPLTVAYSLVARVLPPFTRLVEEGRWRTLRRWTLRLAGLAAIGAVGGYFVGRALGPAAVEILLGAEFRPAPDIAAYAASGVVLATVALFAQQVLIAMKATGRLAVVWLLALTSAAVTVAVTTGLPGSRVGLAFLVGESLALVGLVAAVMSSARPASAGSLA